MQYNSAPMWLHPSPNPIGHVHKASSTVMLGLGRFVMMRLTYNSELELQVYIYVCASACIRTHTYNAYVRCAHICLHVYTISMFLRRVACVCISACACVCV